MESNSLSRSRLNPNRIGLTSSELRRLSPDLLVNVGRLARPYLETFTAGLTNSLEPDRRAALGKYFTRSTVGWQALRRTGLAFGNSSPQPAIRQVSLSLSDSLTRALQQWRGISTKRN